MISGLVLFPFDKTYVRTNFLVDTGADISLISSAAYERAGFKYDQFLKYPPSGSSGYGGKIQARRVPARLYLFDQDEDIVVPVSLELEVIKPMAPKPGEAQLPPLPSVLGRDVSDLFRLTIDRSVDAVTLDHCAGKG